MRTKYNMSLTAYLSVLILAGCNTSESKESAAENTGGEDIRLALFPAPKITEYPALFSYATDSLKKDLNARGMMPMTKTFKEMYFEKGSVPPEVYDSRFDVFMINKISYKSAATLMIYLVREIQDSSYHENDQLVLVMYNNKGWQTDVLANNLQDVFSTRELRFTSRHQFEIIDTDTEYSPDPESEAEDLKTGRIPEPAITTSRYTIDDTLQFKFNRVN